MNEFETEKMLADFRDPILGREYLRRISLFHYLETSELESLYSQGVIKKIQAKSYAVIEGENTRGLFILLSGTVSVYKTDPSTNSMIRLAFLEAGAAFGELSLFDHAPRSASVMAESISYVFYLDATLFEGFLDQNGDNLQTRFYKRCAEEMVERFRSQNSDYIVAQQLLWKYALRSTTGGVSPKD